MTTSKIRTIEAIAILTIVMANKIILNLPKSIIATTGSSAWLNTIYIFIIAILFALFIIKLLKKFPQMDILDISKFLGGKLLVRIVGIMYILLFIFTVNTILKNFSETLKTVYFQQSPIIFLLLFLVLPACFANKYGIKAISKATVFIVPLVFISLIIVLISPIQDFVIQRIFPIFGYGLNATFLTGISNIFALSGLGYIFIIPSLLKNSEDFKKITIASLSISGILMVFSVLCTLLSFSFIINPNENLSLYLMTKIAAHGDLIHGVNTIFILLWILSIIAYISIGLFFTIFVTQKIFAITDTRSINYAYSSILIGLPFFWKNYAQFIYFSEGILKNTILVFVFIINPSILIFANIKKKSTPIQTNN